MPVEQPFAERREVRARHQVVECNRLVGLQRAKFSRQAAHCTGGFSSRAGSGGVSSASSACQITVTPIASSKRRSEGRGETASPAIGRAPPRPRSRRQAVRRRRPQRFPIASIGLGQVGNHGLLAPGRGCRQKLRQSVTEPRGRFRRLARHPARYQGQPPGQSGAVLGLRHPGGRRGRPRSSTAQPWTQKPSPSARWPRSFGSPSRACRRRANACCGCKTPSTSQSRFGARARSSARRATRR